MDELFSGQEPIQSEATEQNVPLAALLAPSGLEDFAGQDHIFAPGRLLRRLVDTGKIRSAVFHGPPGCGKTAMARLIAARTNAKVFELNAVTAGVAELKKILEHAKLAFSGRLEQKNTLLLLDEIHHFNKTQQDVLLPSVERGEIILIGLTTENPFYYINRALLSRFSVFEFKVLSEDALRKIINRALSKIPGGNVALAPEAEKHIITRCGGDARKLLNAFEVAVLSTEPGPQGNRLITLETAAESIQVPALRYDKGDDAHYDHISAFIKSMRGSDPDATVYWLAKMLEAGEDPRFIARRIFICAAEDVGNADPVAVMLADTAFKSAEVLGMPEVRLPLAQAALYVACAPKSNAAYLAIDAALEEVRTGPAREVPDNLKSGGRNKGYVYPHDYPEHYTRQLYMPDPKQFYTPTDQGREKAIAERLDRLKKKK
ncbi:MAG: replication-associated recombination protein A [Elusimicrobiaceae bacterium]|jgi:putative ATPase